MACNAPTERLLATAKQFGMQSVELNAEGFVLSCFYQPGIVGGRVLHIYLEGDGRPWQNGLLPAAEPTTRASLMLPLMAMDSSPALYLGRPCYNGHANDAGCKPNLWTSARYGEQVLGSMTVGIKEFVNRYGYNELVLIGHSGGGSLAMLLSSRVPNTKHLLTLSGNYDINLWADYHGYQHLSESENPADYVNNGALEWHYMGAEDSNIPPKLFMHLLESRANSRVEVLSGVSHQQGWLVYWAEILSRLEGSH